MKLRNHKLNGPKLNGTALLKKKSEICQFTKRKYDEMKFFSQKLMHQTPNCS